MEEGDKIIKLNRKILLCHKIWGNVKKAEKVKMERLFVNS